MLPPSPYLRMKLPTSLGYAGQDEGLRRTSDTGYFMSVMLSNPSSVVPKGRRVEAKRKHRGIAVELSTTARMAVIRLGLFYGGAVYLR